VFQELSLFPHLSVPGNIMIGREVLRGVAIDGKATRHEAQQVLEHLGVRDIPTRVPVGQLSTAEQQIVEIAKCLAKKPRVIIFDEPTASLTAKETQALFRVIKQLKAQHLTILFISHHLEEIYEIAETVTVLRDGAVAYAGPVNDLNPSDIVQYMVGRRLQQFYPPRRGEPGPEVVLELDQATARGVPPVSLVVHSGEILGIGGPIGSGQTPLAELIAGVRRMTRGVLRVRGEELSARDIHQAIAAGIVYVPEDRRTEGLLLNMSMRANMSLPMLINQLTLSRPLGFVRRDLEQQQAERYQSELKIKGILAGPVATLSGGNQQKVAVARWLSMDADIYVFNDPTKGIDVGSKVDIYEVVNQLADAGKAVILISSYNPELLGMCDRIAMMFRGNIVREFAGQEATEEDLLLSPSVN
jgi:ABC-type sugar transport system ATPase subunit